MSLNYLLLIGLGQVTEKNPSRFCIFCNKKQTRLSRHILKRHKDLEIVKTAIKLPEGEKHKMFNKFNKEGIKKYNKKRGKKNLNEEEIINNLEMCGYCNGFFSKRFLSRHIKNCDLNTSKPIIHVPISLIKNNLSSLFPNEFVINVLGNMRNDEVGKICKQDNIILTVGLRLYDKMKRKLDKQSEVLKSVRNDMRRIGHLYSIFKINKKVKHVYNNAMDMLNRINFDAFRTAIDEYTIEGDYLKSENDTVAKKKAQEIDMFVSVFDTWKGYIFGDAEYDINKRRQQKLRKPNMLPYEEDVEIHQNYIIQRLESIMKDNFIFWDNHIYMEVRDLICTRLTLLNARRGGEPASLKSCTSKHFKFNDTELYHVSGWHALHFICTKIKDKLKYPNKLTATANRKRVSTLFAIMDLPPQDRELFYQHMGHSKDINQNVYQVPPALLEITKVGRHLINIEKGKHKVVNRTVVEFYGQLRNERNMFLKI
ncbi:uncharacterized protein LOC136079248 [Hydra vulgaris]|uniref:Uncharacterized protein LOC136079248 n=1 Tax=Hydra vulgaris TaxID=6087 RepID=A0ABM4BPK5_HYDVU